MENIINNEKKMKQRKFLKSKGKHIKKQINTQYKDVMVKSSEIMRLKSSISEKRDQINKINNVKANMNQQILELFGQNIQADMIHFERKKILQEIKASRNKRRNFDPRKQAALQKKMTDSIGIKLKVQVSAKILSN